ncbi:ABC transporter permease [Paraburkholderia fungorum]|jgi:putative ABC transport system permease protein|uniref:ABC transporter permease n=1 Tax=Paraburkholderia fungorum TaxID=134537 RepID=A0AAP5URK1_9BURK|nr:ABC transporter permease [Paraburkholderia fungorum]MDT8835841.1 ABC transporter permease [Paraburkholderia fungorum]
MNLAIRDVRYHLFKFFSSTLGVSLLIMVVIAIGGIVRGVISDSSTIIEKTGADLWVVQAYGANPEGRTLGPFVETSRLPEHLYHAIETMPGVAQVSPLALAWEHVEMMPRPTPLMKFMYMNTLLNTATMVKRGWMNMPHTQRFIVIGYEPGKIRGPPVIVAGRGIVASHYEIVADVGTGFHVGQRPRLGNFDYTVVGLTRNMVGFTADPVIYATLLDAQNIIFQLDPDLLRNERPIQIQGLAGLSSTQPRLAGALADKASSDLANTLFVNAIAVKLRPGVSPQEVAGRIGRWQHLAAYTASQQVNMQLMGSNRLILFQLALFRDILVLIAGVVIGLIIYTFTLDKLHEIAMLKLLGAQGRIIYQMILQEALFMGIVGTLAGSGLELLIEPYFPRRVIATYGDIGQMLVAMSVVAILASVLAVRRAMRVDPRSVLSTG